MRRPRRRTTGVIDPDTDRPTPVDLRLHRYRQRWQITRVNTDVAMLLSFGGRQLLDDLGQFFFTAGQNDNLRSLQRQLSRTSGAQSLAGPADQGSFSS